MCLKQIEGLSSVNNNLGIRGYTKMITLDYKECTKCGICLTYLGGYCINEREGRLEIDYTVCNECQKCVAVCPSMAYMNNHTLPKRIKKPLPINEADFIDFLSRRRSIKHFKSKKISREVLKKLMVAASFAPTMNKNIEAVVIDDADIIQVFADTLPIIKRKMERDLVERGHIVKDNTQALILLLGKRRVPATENSAQYYLANMLLYCETIGLGSCLMDSLKFHSMPVNR